MGSSKVVLVIDDDAAVTRFVVGILRPLGYKVEVAENGLKGLERIGKEKVDLVLLDLVMPKMNGYQFCKALEKKKLKILPPVVLMSSVGELVASRMKNTTCTVDYVPKPVTAQKLRTIVDKFLAAADPPKPDEV